MSNIEAGMPDRSYRALTDLMRALIQSDTDAAQAALTRTNHSPEELLALLDRHRLTGYFHVLVRDTPLASEFRYPGGVDLQAAYLAQEQRALNNLGLIQAIGERLEFASIPFLTIKGLGQAQRFFADIRHRFMWDLDILVRPQDLAGAIEQVKACGLHPTSAINVNTRNRLWGIHALEFRGEAGKLDVHVALRNLQGVCFDYGAIWRNAQWLDVKGVRLPILCDEHTLLTAAVGMGSDIQRGGHNLRKIWDIYIMLLRLDGELDWQAFFSRRDQEGSGRLVLNVFAFVAHLLGVLDEWPRLALVMEQRHDQLIIDSASKACEVFERERGGFANRVLYARLLPVSAARYWLQWLLTFPVRYFHYRSNGNKSRSARLS